MKEQLSQRYALETLLLRLKRAQTATAEDIKQAKYDIRNKTEDLLNYEGSLRGFLDKFSGKREEKLDSLRQAQSREESRLASLLREQETLIQKRAGAESALASLPPLEVLREADEEEWAILEARYCAEALLPLLEETEKALLEYRELMQRSRPEALSLTAQQEIYTAPNAWGEKCRPLIERLRAALAFQKISLAPGGFFESPTAYLVTVAAKHNRFDRVNQALDQTQTLLNLSRRILGE